MKGQTTFCRVCFLAVIVTFWVTLGDSQTKWFKYEGNPVLDVGPPSSWDGQGLGAPRIVVRDSKYHMWYTGRRGSNVWRIGHATSRDGVNWQKSSSNPVLIPTESWEENHMWLAEVVFLNSEFKMWFNGLDNIGYATSRDGELWRKHPGNPVLRSGPSTWDRGHVSWPCVQQNNGTGLRMWFAGVDDRQQLFQIGYATATNETSWNKFEGNPILSPGILGAWDDRGLETPRVFFDGSSYQMWFAGSRSGLNIFLSSTGYAKSSDGINWTKDERNPILSPGPSGSWDSQGASVGDVFFDGNFYHMWYTGNDYGSTLRIGYALSPKGMDLSVSPSFVIPLTGAVRISARVNQQSALSFLAKITTTRPAWSSGSESVGKEVQTIELFDDGEHGDSLANDGMFANDWRPKEEALYFIDLVMKKKASRALTFEMKKSAFFTAIGPLRLDSLVFLGNAAPCPGDSVFLKLVLRNDGSSVPASAVTASLSTTDPRMASIGGFSQSYGDIAPGAKTSTSGYYRLFIHPDCPPDSDVKVAINISSSGVHLWTDSFSLRVLPPWWRTNLAYALYAALGLVVLYGARRYEIRRTRLKHQRELEHVEAKKLRELDQLKSRFFTNISHEFRTPITLIEGPVKQLQSGEFTGDTQEQYDLILRNSRHLLHLVNQLLDLAKVESGEMKRCVRHQDLAAAVKTIASAFESTAKQKGVEFTIQGVGDRIVGWFDRDTVEKIVTNLLSNAFKFTSEGGRVCIDVRHYISELQDDAGICVTDTGVGIPPEEVDKVFDRFYQVQASQNHGYNGTGIGLALTKELVELNHGGIHVTSEVGKGSIFSVWFPIGEDHVKPDEMVEQPAEPETVSRADWATETATTTGKQNLCVCNLSLPILLIVEDNKDMRKYMRTIIDCDYRVIESADGEDGLQKAIENVPDIIISDVMMPKLDGFALCAKLKADERTSHIPVVLLTAKAEMDQKIEGLEKGADEYLTKPFDARELLVRVRNLVELRKKLRERFRNDGSISLRDVTVTSADGRFLKRAMEVVENHIAEQNFSSEVFAKEMFLSRMQLHRKIKALTDHSPGEFVRTVRLERARRLLRQHVGTIAEIAYQVGYDEPSHFTEAFRRHFAVTPSEFANHEANHKK